MRSLLSLVAVLGVALLVVLSSLVDDARAHNELQYNMHFAFDGVDVPVALRDAYVSLVRAQLERVVSANDARMLTGVVRARGTNAPLGIVVGTQLPATRSLSLSLTRRVRRTTRLEWLPGVADADDASVRNGCTRATYTSAPNATLGEPVARRANAALWPPFEVLYECPVDEGVALDGDGERRSFTAIVQYNSERGTFSRAKIVTRDGSRRVVGTGAGRLVAYDYDAGGCDVAQLIADADNGVDAFEAVDDVLSCGADSLAAGEMWSRDGGCRCRLHAPRQHCGDVDGSGAAATSGWCSAANASPLESSSAPTPNVDSGKWNVYPRAFPATTNSSAEKTVCCDGSTEPAVQIKVTGTEANCITLCTSDVTASGATSDEELQQTLLATLTSASDRPHVWAMTCDATGAHCRTTAMALAYESFVNVSQSSDATFDFGYRTSSVFNHDACTKSGQPALSNSVGLTFCVDPLRAGFHRDPEFPSEIVEHITTSSSSSLPPLLPGTKKKRDAASASSSSSTTTTSVLRATLDLMHFNLPPTHRLTIAEVDERGVELESSRAKRSTAGVAKRGASWPCASFPSKAGTGWWRSLADVPEQSAACTCPTNAADQCDCDTEALYQLVQIVQHWSADGAAYYPREARDGSLGARNTYITISAELFSALDDVGVSFDAYAAFDSLHACTWSDCDGNLVDDTIDIAAGRVADTNGNLVPDQCDYRDGVDYDCNNDNIADSTQMTLDQLLASYDTCSRPCAFQDALGEQTTQACACVLHSSGNGLPECTPQFTPLEAESFELPPTPSSYTLSPAASDNGQFDFFGRYAVPETGGNAARDDFIGGFDGSYAILLQDPPSSTVSVNLWDISLRAMPPTVSVTIALGALASEPSFSNYEAADDDGVKVYASLDSGAPVLIGRFSPPATGAGDLRVDADLDGIGEGDLVDATLRDFSFELPRGGATRLDLRIDLTSTSGFEPLALDNVRVGPSALPPSAPSSAPSSSTRSLAAVYINEFLVDPHGALFNFDTDDNGTPNDADEFIELYNAGPTPWDASGLQFWDSGDDNYFSVPSGSEIAPGGFLLVVVGVQAGGALPTVNSATSLAFDAGRSSLVRNDGDNIVVLQPSTGEYLHAIFNGDSTDTVTSYSGWPVTSPTLVHGVVDFGSDTDGTSLALSPDGDTSNPVRHNTLSANASPGASNV